MGKRKHKKCNSVSFSMEGDTIKIELIDTYFNVYYKTKANINNKTQMQRLVNELKEKGINFPKATTQKINDFLNIKELENWV